jgi:hypothetical protein
VPNLDLTNIDLPDLTDTSKYPTVEHGPSCTDDGPIDGRTCHPGTLTRPREYAYPTEALGKLKFTWNNFRELIPIPPRVGVHCPTIATEDNVSVGDAASASTEIQSVNGDACLPRLINSIVFPCTRIQPEVSLVTGYPAAASWAAPVNVRDNNQCIQQLLLNLKLPGCTSLTTNPSANAVQMVPLPSSAGITRTIINQSGPTTGCRFQLNDVVKVPCVVPTLGVTSTVTGATGGLTLTQSGDACNRVWALALNLAVSGGGGGGSTSGGGFVVGTPGSHTPPFGSAACATVYMPGEEVPVTDVKGVLGAPNTQISPTANKIVNSTNRALAVGDIVDIVMTTLTAGLRTIWDIV